MDDKELHKYISRSTIWSPTNLIQSMNDGPQYITRAQLMLVEQYYDTHEFRGQFDARPYYAAVKKHGWALAMVYDRPKKNSKQPLPEDFEEYKIDDREAPEGWDPTVDVVEVVFAAGAIMDEAPGDAEQASARAADVPTKKEEMSTDEDGTAGKAHTPTSRSFVYRGLTDADVAAAVALQAISAEPHGLPPAAASPGPRKKKQKRSATAIATVPTPSPTPFPTAASPDDGARVPSQTNKKASSNKIKKQMEALLKHMDAMEDAHNATKAQLEEANKALKKTTEELTKSRNIAASLCNFLREHDLVD